MRPGSCSTSYGRKTSPLCIGPRSFSDKLLFKLQKCHDDFFLGGGNKYILSLEAKEMDLIIHLINTNINTKQKHISFNTITVSILYCGNYSFFLLQERRKIFVSKVYLECFLFQKCFSKYLGKVMRFGSAHCRNMPLLVQLRPVAYRKGLGGRGGTYIRW